MLYTHSDYGAKKRERQFLPTNLSHAHSKTHYMTASEQERIEFFAPGYLKHIVVIMTEMGLRPYRELLPMLKSQVDLENRLVHISDSKTDNGIGDMPMTEPAYKAFKDQIEQTTGSEYLFPRLTARGSKPYLCNVKKAWRTALRRAKVPYFSLYELRQHADSRIMPTGRKGSYRCGHGVPGEREVVEFGEGAWRSPRRYRCEESGVGSDAGEGRSVGSRCEVRRR
jgi:integrase